MSQENVLEQHTTEEHYAENKARLDREFLIRRAQEDRRAEYPPITDYIDGVVKGDQTQVDAYIAACQAVKAKYPKPE